MDQMNTYSTIPVLETQQTKQNKTIKKPTIITTCGGQYDKHTKNKKAKKLRGYHGSGASWKVFALRLMGIKTGAS